MIRRILTFLVLLSWMCAPSETNAQTLPSILLLTQDTSYKESRALLMVSGQGMVGSNTTDISFIKKNVKGGYIEDVTLDKLSRDALLLNRAGAAASTGIDIFSFSDTVLGRPQWGIRAGLSTNYHASLSYSRDLFRTVYRGNAPFAGDTVQLAPLLAQYQAWQKFNIGLFNKKTLSSVSLSLVAGEKYHSLSVADARLYTTTNGDSITLSYIGNYLRSDTLKRGWANGSGLGLAMDADYNLPIAGNEGVIRLAMRDVGFAIWNNRSEEFLFDSSTTFTGVNADNLFELNTDTIGFDRLKDSISFSSVQKSIAAMLPMSFHIRFSKFLNDKNFYELGMSLWPTRSAIPLVNATLNHFISPNFVFSEGISYGGYGTWGIAASMQWMPRGNWLLSVCSQHIGGFTLGSARSRDISFCVAKVISRTKDPLPVE